MISCPHDGAGLNSVTIVSHYGQPLHLDQCPQCGGIWFDESELFRARQGEAVKVESADIECISQPEVKGRKYLICPRDGTMLVRFTDRYFPSEIILERCPACRGLWLNRGHFTDYQNYRERKLTARIESAGDRKLDEELNKLAAEHRAGNSTETMRRLGEFLSTPMEPGAPRSAEAEGAVNALISVLMTLFRVFVLRV